MKKDTFINCVAALVVLLFAYTSVSKFLDYHRFVFQMALSPLPVMKTAAPVLGYLIPAGEAATVILLLNKKWQLKGLRIALILFILFEVYIVGMLISGRDLPCTCGGIINTLSWKQHVLFNACFIVLTAGALFFYPKQQSSDHSTAKHKDLSRA